MTFINKLKKAKINIKRLQKQKSWKRKQKKQFLNKIYC